MMTVARRNRVWTQELRAKLVQDVRTFTQEGQSKVSAFKALSGQWGASPDTLSTAYYESVRIAPTASKKVVKKVKVSDTNAMDILAVIQFVKRLGGTVTF